FRSEGDRHRRGQPAEDPIGGGRPARSRHDLFHRFPRGGEFGPDGLRFRLADSGAKAIVTDAANLPKIRSVAGDLPDLATIFSI
ncbi:hypothetical protein CNY89_28800, partial [Amaricoccus sp. HAR-UPW-R2A-40]